LKTTGEGLLVEYAGIVDAVDCAVIQRGMLVFNARVHTDRQIVLRVTSFSTAATS
jgi:hypothetical protein